MKGIGPMLKRNSLNDTEIYALFGITMDT